MGQGSRGAGRATGPAGAGAAIALAAILFASSGAEGRAAPVAMDGLFDEWGGIETAWTDPPGDAGGGAIDLVEIAAANDRRHLFLRIRLGTEVILQESNRITLYVDTDDDPSTGEPQGEIGADLSWTFGERRGEFAGRSIRWPAVGMVGMPSHSGREFEISLLREARPGGAPLFPSGTIRIVVRDRAGGDRMPNGDASIRYDFDDSIPFDPEEISLGKGDSHDVRIMTYNVEFDGPWAQDRSMAQSRLLDAIAPDVIALQEIYDHTGDETRSWVTSRLRGRWFQVWDRTQLHTLSRYPFLGAWVASPGRAWAALIDLPDTFDYDLLLINVHLSCCTANSDRQRQIDEVMGFVRDAKSGADEVEIPRGTAIVILGDTNMYGYDEQVRTLLTGDIADNVSFGPDFRPDWNGSDFEALLSRQSGARQYYTWYDEGSDYGPGYIDRITYSGSTMNVAKSYVLHTPSLTAHQLSRNNLTADDSPRASDHMPHVMDIRGKGGPAGSDTPPAPSAKLDSRPNPFNPATTFTFELESESYVSLVVFDAAGRLVDTIRAETMESGPHAVSWEAPDRLPSGIYFARLKADRREERTKITLVR